MQIFLLWWEFFFLSTSFTLQMTNMLHSDQMLYCLHGLSTLVFLFQAPFFFTWSSICSKALVLHVKKKCQFLYLPKSGSKTMGEKLVFISDAWGNQSVLSTLEELHRFDLGSRAKYCICPKAMNVLHIGLTSNIMAAIRGTLSWE